MFIVMSQHYFEYFEIRDELIEIHVNSFRNQILLNEIEREFGDTIISSTESDSAAGPKMTLTGRYKTFSITLNSKTKSKLEALAKKYRFSIHGKNSTLRS